nr:subunit 6 of NADH-plastoquinone oxidoreductase [Streptofilum sp. BC4-VF8pt]WKT08743.1 subunit 6 of NADH-plastoquinone oxidoreductase [Streptofilum sp. ZNP2-VF4pt]
MNLEEYVQSVSLHSLQLGIVIGTLGVVFLANAVYAAFLLGFVFICIALIYLLFNADFLAAAQVLIYVGAINVLILFAIMLVNKKQEGSPGTPNNPTVGAALICSSLFFLLSSTIFTTSWPVSSTKALEQNLEIIGTHLFSDFLLGFEVLSVVLLISLIGAIVIARKEELPSPENEKMLKLHLPNPLKTSESKEF